MGPRAAECERGRVMETTERSPTGAGVHGGLGRVVLHDAQGQGLPSLDCPVLTCGCSATSRQDGYRAAILGAGEGVFLSRTWSGPAGPSMPSTGAISMPFGRWWTRA